MPTVYPGSRSYFGIGKETTPGTAVVAAQFPPWTKMDPADAPKILEDTGMRGSMGSQFGSTLGPTLSGGDFDGPVMDDSLGQLLYNILGDYAVTGAGPYVHTFGLLNSGSAQPVTHTIVDASGMTPTVGARVYAYSCLSELTLTGNAENLFVHSGKFTSNLSAPAASAPTNTPTTEQVVPSWRSVVTIGGTPATNVAEWEITIKRQLAVKYTGNGTNAPYIIGRGDVSVDGKLTFVAADESPLTALNSNTQQALVFAVDNGLATTNQRTITATLSKAYYKTAKPKRDTLIGWDVEFTGLLNATDAAASGGLAPCKVTVKNAVTTY
ncbi:MAG: phage tail tube protein [Actinoallomurus sp.]